MYQCAYAFTNIEKLCRKVNFIKTKQNKMFENNLDSGEKHHSTIVSLS